MSATTQQFDHAEGNVARTVENQTSRVPSDYFLLAALGSIAASLVFKALDRSDEANFIGHWAPTFLALGIYNKMLKQNK